MKLFTSLLFVIILCFNNFTYSLNGQSNENSQSILQVVPNSYAGTGGTASFLGPLANAQRTYQLLIHANQLAPLTGTNLTGINFRLPLSAVANWPVSPVLFSNYDIYLSPSVDPINRSLVFANNVAGPQIQVRSGSLNIPTGVYTFGSNPNQFGPDITFNIPYFYNGGNLLVEIRHTGFTGTSRSVDAIGTATPGYGTDVSACWTGNYTGTTGSQGNFTIAGFTSQVSFQPVLDFYQINYDMNGYVENLSDWGMVKVTTTGYSGLRYFNLAVNLSGTQTIWQVQNAILFNQAPLGELQSSNFAFDIGDKGIPVLSLPYGYTITDYPLVVPPSITDNGNVFNTFYNVYDGFPFFNTNSDGLKIPDAKPFQNTGSVKDNASHGVEKMPNQDCGVNECAPAAFSNSLKFLKKQHNLVFDSAFASLDSMKKATGFGGGTMTVENYYLNKAEYLKKNNIPITTRKINKEKIFDLQKELDNDQDIEMFVWWFKIDTITGDTSTGSHLVNVTNIKKLGGGKYQITAQDDRKQGSAGGTESETVTYDSATNSFTSGTYVAYNMGVYEYVVECPNELTTTQVTPPNNSSGVSPADPLTWIAIAGASSYWLEIATDPFFQNYAVNQEEVPDAFYNPSPGELLPLTQYFWRVRVNDSAGPGSYISIFDFTTSSSKILFASALVQGLYNGSMVPDTMRIELRNTFPPYALIETSIGMLDELGNGSFNFYSVTDGVPYYAALNHRNSINTYSNPTVVFNGGIANYSFVNSASQAYGNNMIQVDNAPVRYAIYNGDVNKDGVIDATDLSAIDNDAASFVSGYVVTDLNGDEFIDGSDFALADNNAQNFVGAIIP